MISLGETNLPYWNTLREYEDFLHISSGYSKYTMCSCFPYLYTQAMWKNQTTRITESSRKARRCQLSWQINQVDSTTLQSRLTYLHESLCYWHDVLISPGSLYQSQCSRGSKLTARLVSHFSLSTLFLIICLQSKYKHIRPSQQRIKSYVFRKEPTTPLPPPIQHTQFCHTNSCYSRAQRTDTVCLQYYQYMLWVWL